jgi:Toxin co-regulated pilus biosynthesis protein Q
MMHSMVKKLLVMTLVLLWAGTPTQAEYRPRRPPDRPPNHWCTRSGETLKRALERWSQQAAWVLQWQSAYDYPIAVPTCLTGHFFTVLKTVSQAYQQAEQPLYFDLYPPQRLLVITQ